MDVVGKVFITWEEVEQLVKELAKQVDTGSIKFIHGLSRGGLIPAVMLSHATGIPYTSSPSIKGKKCLIVDDICDSGKTLEEWHEHTTAVLHHKPHTASVTPSIWSKLFIGDDWIVYPWECDDSKTIQDYKLDK